jgi:membrane-bound inhibitor of C-type lysozyme
MRPALQLGAAFSRTIAVVATAIAMTTPMLPAVLAPQTAQAALAAPAKPSASMASTTAAANPGKAATAGDKARAAARKATVAAGAAAAAAATTLALASDEQRHAYTLAHLGEYQCEFKRMIRVLAHPRQEGYVDLHFDKQVVTARPVLSSTGAVRLEDVKGRYLMVQIAFKSMLMDTKIGQRVADECLHDAHHEARRAAAEAPPAEGLGITVPGPTN